MKPLPPSRKAFTLIELLVVISIIGILMGLLFPAIQGAINQARKAAAKNDVVQIANAVIAYQTEYGKLPPDASGTVSGVLLDALIVTNPTANTNNVRRIVFLDAPTYKKGKSGVSNTSYVDPWGGVYQIVMDTTYSNYVVPSGVTPSVTVRKPVAVWNPVPVIGSTTNTNLQVKSWE